MFHLHSVLLTNLILCDYPSSVSSSLSVAYIFSLSLFISSLHKSPHILRVFLYHSICSMNTYCLSCMINGQLHGSAEAQCCVVWNFVLQQHSFNHLLADLHKNMYTLIANIVYTHTMHFLSAAMAIRRRRVCQHHVQALLLWLNSVFVCNKLHADAYTACSRGQFFHVTNSLWFSRKHIVFRVIGKRAQKWKLIFIQCSFPFCEWLRQSVIDTLSRVCVYVCMSVNWLWNEIHRIFVIESVKWANQFHHQIHLQTSTYTQHTYTRHCPIRIDEI